MAALEFHYRIPWRARGSYPGHHRGSAGSGGFEFRGHAPLGRAPDPRRFDLRASLRDPFGHLQFRVFHQRSSIPVYVIADLSASMNFGHKPTILKQFTAASGYSAFRSGDPFGFIGCHRQIVSELFQPLTRARGAGVALSGRLAAFRPDGAVSTALSQASALLTGGRALVFLLSDFYFPIPLLEQTLATLGQHTVIPVIIRDRRETQTDTLPRYGLIRVRDAETGTERTVMLRPALRTKLLRRAEWRETCLNRCFATRGLRPLTLTDRFEADQVTRYFYG